MTKLVQEANWEHIGSRVPRSLQVFIQTLLFFFTSAERVVISKDTAFSEMTLDVLFQLLVQVCFALQLDKSTDSPFLSSQSCTIVYTLLCD